MPFTTSPQITSPPATYVSSALDLPLHSLPYTQSLYASGFDARSLPPTTSQPLVSPLIFKDESAAFLKTAKRTTEPQRGRTSGAARASDKALRTLRKPSSVRSPSTKSLALSASERRFILGLRSSSRASAGNESVSVDDLDDYDAIGEDDDDFANMENEEATEGRARGSSTGTGGGSPSAEAASPNLPMPTLRFVTTTDPTQFKDRSTMRGNRSHVMYNHLKQKPRRSPSASPGLPSEGSSTRASKSATQSRQASGSSSKARRQSKGKDRARQLSAPELDTSSGGSGHLPESLDLPSGAASSSGAASPFGLFPDDASIVSHPHSRQSSMSTMPLSWQPDFLEEWEPQYYEPAQTESSSSFYASPSFAPMTASHDFDPLLIHSRADNVSQTLIDAAFQDHGPFKHNAPSAEPFQALPALDSDAFRFHYNRLLQSSAMSRRWIPLLTGSKVAFSGSICLAAAHMDAIKSSSVESYEGAAAKLTVMHLINQSMNDPSELASDSVIASAAQLLLCEHINLGDSLAASHSTGIDRMIGLRGGLANLGLDGDLAGIVCATNFLSSVLRSSQPGQFHLAYFTDMQWQAISPSVPLPESPLFCPRADFYTLSRSTRCRKHTFGMLADLRDLTIRFLAAEQHHHLSSRTASTYEDASEQLDLASRVFRLPSAADPNAEGAACYGDWTYEACRLAALIYAQSMVSHTPLATSAGTAATASGLSSASMLLLRLHDALARSGCDGNWEDMIGTLVWVSVVGAAAARDVSDPEILPTKRWLTALTVQTTLLLTFEHKQAVLSSIHKLLSVQRYCTSSTTAATGNVPLDF